MAMESLLDALAQARVYDLEQPRYFGSPIFPSHAPGFVYTLHRRHERGVSGEARSSASGSYYSTEHSGTHIDALCHQAENLTLYGGREIGPQLQTSTGFTELGVETIPPLLGRGILLDIARSRGVERVEDDQPITRADLQTVARQQGVEVREGDIVLVRTGNGVTTDGLFFLGCNNVTPNGTTYSFTAADGQPSPITGTITGISILIDVQGTADISNIKVNGVNQVVLVGPPTAKSQCLKGGWKTFNNPSFKNQGQCVSYVEHHSNHGQTKPKHSLKHHGG